MSRYAQGTTVSVERSRVEAERTLQRYGATGFGYSWARRREPVPHPEDCTTCHGARQVERRSVYPQGTPGLMACPRFCLSPSVVDPPTLEREVVQIVFEMQKRAIRLEVPMPTEREAGGSAKKRDAAVRQRWRALVLVLKAKLEAVASGISTLEAEFLANVVMNNGMTLGQALIPRLSEAVSSGRLLPPTGGEG